MIRTLLLAVLVSIGAHAAEAEHAPGTLRSVSCEVGGHPSAAIARRIAEADPDVICLSGVPAGTAALLARRLRMYSVQRRGQAVLSRHPIADTRELKLSATACEPALIVRLEVRGAPAGVWVACPAAFTEAQEALARAGVSAAAPLICGEFWGAPGETAVRTLSVHPLIPRLPM